MFALGLRYLMGWSMAADDGAKKEHAEWPPHPDRLFMALAAGWFEMGQDAAEGEALRWLEALPRPAISVSNARRRHADRSPHPVTSYVPVNDGKVSNKLPKADALDKLKEAGLDRLPQFRARQPRSFPVAIPDRDTVFFVWPDADADDHLSGLERLATNVTHLGHPASLVQVWIEDDPPAPNLRPTDGAASMRLRVPCQGRLDHLHVRMNRDDTIAYADLRAAIEEAKQSAKVAQGDKKKKLASTRKALEAELASRFGNHVPESRRPEDAQAEGYTDQDSPPTASATRSVFDPRLVILGFERRYPLTATQIITEALRGAILKHCPAPIPEWVSGHAQGGIAPSKLPHLALAALPWVGNEHADGRIMGAAIIVPRNVDQAEAARCLHPLLWNMSDGVPADIQLFDGQWLDTVARLELRESPPHSLRMESWTRPSRVWASVTPIVLDHHFKGADKWAKAAENIKAACERVGLPTPVSIVLNGVSMIEGVPSAREFPPMHRKSDGGRMQHAHGIIVFAEPVAGPVLLGAGRFRGYGLCRPMDGANGHA